eukprot:TRINITY_DN635_c0_g1_i7.p1 TRINITY_DN635_c0_g1~~TRINITY_DN635_c0_g1_i7.p1  ORF type:complete len:2560 (+),score=862.47 TRINITY_DN635_c0_g1_i7:2323-10002(+)
MITSVRNSDISLWFFFESSILIIFTATTSSLSLPLTTEKTSDKADNQSNYTLILHQWTHNNKKLVETCSDVLGPDFKFNSDISSPSNEVKATKIIQEMNSTGSVSLITGNYDQCQRLSYELAFKGGLVTIASSSSSSSSSSSTSNDNPEKESMQNVNKNLANRWPKYWEDGSIASALLSECVALLRYLINSSSEWAQVSSKVIEEHLQDLPTIIDSFIHPSEDKQESERTSYGTKIAILCLLGGFHEAIRIGANVLIKNYHGDSNVQGTVVSYEPGLSSKAEVVLGGVEDHPFLNVDVSNLVAVPELNLSNTFINGLAKSIVPSLLSVIHSKQSDISKESKLIHSEFQSRSLAALVGLSVSEETINVLLSPLCINKIPILVNIAKQCDVYKPFESLVNDRIKLSQQLWNLQTYPDNSTLANSMSTLLPYFPHSKKADILPTYFERSHLGLIFYGSERCNMEYTGSANSTSNRPLFGSTSKTTEVILQANVPFPVTMDYYFETTIEKVDSQSIVSIGLCPEGTTAWGNGCYTYQANKLKTCYQSSQRKQEPYGNYFKSKSVIGCGWDEKNHCIYFTYDGEHLGPAFDVTLNGSERLTPTIGLGKGVRVKVNFGSSPFKYNLTETQIDENDETAQQRRQEAEEKMKIELEKLEKQRKEEQEAIERERLQAAEPLMAMGYSKYKAFKAMEMTEWAGPNEAVMWLLENPDYPDEEPVEPEPQPEVDNTKDETDKTVTEENVKTTETVSNDNELPELQYKPNNTSAFILKNSCNFDSSKKEKTSNTQDLANEWEERFVPELKAFMERDGFSRFQIQDHLEQIRQALRQGREDEAANIYYRIVGDQGSQIPLTSMMNESDNVLRIDQIHLGDILTVKEFNINEMPTSVSSLWDEKMNSTIGRSGMVKAIDQSQQLVLVCFYSGEIARLEQWWYPLSVLQQQSKPTNIESPLSFSLTLADEDVGQVAQKVSESQEKVANVYARKLVLLLLKHSSLTLEQPPLPVLDVLHLYSAESLSDSNLITSTNPLLNAESIDQENIMLNTKLEELCSKCDQEQQSSLYELLLNDCINSFNDARSVVSKLSTSISSDPNEFGNPVKVELEGVHSIIVIFDRGVHLPQDINVQLGFYYDKNCKQSIKLFGDKSFLTPFVIPSNCFYHRITSRHNQNSSSCKYKFSIVPVSLRFSIGRWLTEFLIRSKAIMESETNVVKIFNTLLDFNYSNKIPSVLKEITFSLLTSIIHKLCKMGKVGRRILGSLPWLRIEKMREEMTILQDGESRRGTLFSSYTQSLVNFMIACKIQHLHRSSHNSTCESSIDLFSIQSVSEKESSGSSGSDKVESDENNEADYSFSDLFGNDDDIFTPTKSEKKEPPVEEKKVSKEEDTKQTTSSPAASTSTTTTTTTVDEKPPTPTDKTPSESTEPKTNPEPQVGMLFDDEEGDDDMDEDLKLALQMSLSEAGGDTSGGAQPTTTTTSTTSFTSNEGESSDSEEDKDDEDEDETKGEEGEDKKSKEDTKTNTATGSDTTSTDNTTTKQQEDNVEKTEEPTPQATTSTSPSSSSSAPDKVSDLLVVEAISKIYNALASSGGIKTESDIPPPPPPPAANTTTTTTKTTKSSTSTTSSSRSSKVKATEPAWFTDLISVIQMLEIFYVRDVDPTSMNKKYYHQVLKNIINTAWKESKEKYEVKEKIIMINNIPTVPSEKKAELETELIEFLDDHVSIVKGSLYIPIDESNTNNNNKTTQPWCFVQITSKSLIYEFENKLTKLKFKLSSSSPSSEEGKTMTITRISDIDQEESSKQKQPESTQTKENNNNNVDNNNNKQNDKDSVNNETPSSDSNNVNNQSKDETSPSPSQPQPQPQPQSQSQPQPEASPPPSNIQKLNEYLRSFLYSDSTKSLTNECKELYTEIFEMFAGSKDGSLPEDKLNQLQTLITGESFKKEDVEYILSQFETKKTKKQSSVSDESGTESDEVIGLTLNGFLAAHVAQCDMNPYDTWKELWKLGYDMHMTPNFYLTLDDAMSAIIDNMKEHDPKTAHGHQLHIDEQIVHYAESIFSESRDMKLPTSLNITQILPIKGENSLGQIYPSLVNMDPRLLKLRFEILRQLNNKIGSVLPYFDLQAASSCSYVRNLIRYRGLLFHSVKMEFFYSVLDKTSVDTPQPTVSYNRLKLASRLEKRDPNEILTEDQIVKNTAFGIAFSQLKDADPEAFRQRRPQSSEPHFSLLIDFRGEHVEGEGGPYRQFFTDVSRELRSRLPLLLPCPNAQTKTGKNRDKFIIAPSMKSRMNLKMYRFLGQLMGMSIRTGVLLILDLPSFVWKPILGIPPNMNDLESVDISFVHSMQFFRACAREDMEKRIFEKFSIPLSDKSTHLLKKDGNNIDLTYDTRDEYISLAERARLNESKLQINEIRRGISDVIPIHLLNILTWNDLEWRVCGKPTIDIKLLKRHTHYSEVSPSSPHIIYFWNVLNSASQEERRAFLRFSWGQERLPANDQEFKRTSTRMLIKPYSGSNKHPDQAFPKADTCFFNLHLPEYSSLEVLRERLMFAIHTDADSMNADNPQDDDDYTRGRILYDL